MSCVPLQGTTLWLNSNCYLLEEKQIIHVEVTTINASMYMKGILQDTMSLSFDMNCLG